MAGPGWRVPRQRWDRYLGDGAAERRSLPDTAPTSKPGSGHGHAVNEPRERRILLLDCDAFYVQVARLEDPRGAGRAKLLVVGGSPSGRGVVTSASYEARAFGVRSAMPTAQALRLCPNATVVGVPRESVSRWSRKVKSVLEELAPTVQAASVDEFYLDMTGTERLLRDETFEETAWRIRKTVAERTGVSVSLGGGTRRIIAKLAATFAKPAGVRIVPAGAEQSFLEPLDLSAIPGVGPALVASLRKRGLVTVRDALPVEQVWMERWLGRRRGAWLYRCIRGVDPSPVDPRERRKSISSERTFSHDLTDDPEIEHRLLGLATSIAGTLRRKGYRARTVTVKLRDPDFSTRQHTRTVPDPIESNAAIVGVARALLHELRTQRRAAVRLLGVGLSGLEPAEANLQLPLFEESVREESERDRDVSRALDRLRDRFGESVVVPGSMVDGGRASDDGRPGRGSLE